VCACLFTNMMYVSWPRNACIWNIFTRVLRHAVSF